MSLDTFHLYSMPTLCIKSLFLHDVDYILQFHMTNIAATQLFPSLTVSSIKTVSEDSQKRTISFSLAIIFFFALM